MFLLTFSSQSVRRLVVVFVSLTAFMLLIGQASVTTAQAPDVQIDPSFQLVRGVPDTCSAAAGEEFRFEALNNVSFGSGSNLGTFSVDGIGQVASFAGNHNQPDDFPLFGDGFYDFVIDQGYDVASGTAITIEITTYTGLNQAGQLAYRSTLTYTCDLGETISLDNQVLLDAANVQPGFIFDLPTIDPAFELVEGVPDTCSAVVGEEFRFDTFNNASFGSGSNLATLSVEGIGEVANFAGNHNQSDTYPTIGNGFYDIVIDESYDVPAGSVITVEIITYTGLNQTGQPAYRSTLTYDCDLALDNTVTNEALLTSPPVTDPATPTGQIPPVEPAFALTTGVPNTCDVEPGETIRFDTFNNVRFGNTSNEARLSVPGVGFVSSIANNHDQPLIYPSIGAGFYEFVVDTNYNVPQGSVITVEITTYSGLNQSGDIVYRSTLIYDCSTGEVVSLNNDNLQGLPGT